MHFVGLMLRRPTVVGSTITQAAEVYGFLRGNGGIFSFTRNSANISTSVYYARGVAVCGADFYIDGIAKIYAN